MLLTHPGKGGLLILVDPPLQVGDEALLQPVGSNHRHPANCLTKVGVDRRLGRRLQAFQLPRTGHVHPAMGYIHASVRHRKSLVCPSIQISYSASSLNLNSSAKSRICSKILFNKIYCNTGMLTYCNTNHSTVVKCGAEVKDVY
jgi:hypothetical protein